MERDSPPSLAAPEPSTSLAEASAPLLDNGRSLERSASRPPRGRTMEAARYLRRAGSSRFMREQSVVVRETAAEQLEERQSDWAYSRPVVVLDLIWNLAFVTVASVVLLLSQEEASPAPLRVWVVGYAIQCVVHMTCVWSEYRRRRAALVSSGMRGTGSRRAGGEAGSSVGDVLSQVRREGQDDGDGEEEGEGEEVERREGASLAKRLESANTMFSFVWWIVGFWWILSGLDQGFTSAPLLSWLCTVFLAFDVFFVVFCVALACVIGIAVCCCLPCIIAILYAVADQQEGASDDDIKALPKYRFCQAPAERGVAKVVLEDSKVERRAGTMALVGSTERPVERQLSADDAECCICLSAYEDGAELRELPCLHHFHCTCIDKWLKTKPTCPLCKYDIVHGREGPSASPPESISAESPASSPPQPHPNAPAGAV